MPPSRPHVVIIGGGFGGLEAAKALRRAPVRVTLVDRRNHHLFQPLLYQVATAGLSAPEIAAPIRQVLRRQRNVTVLLGTVTEIDVDARRVVLEDGVLDYDYLIVAAGAQTSYFGHDDWEAHAPGLKSVEDAFEVRRRILLAYEAAERAEDEEVRRQCLTFVIVGGGPTGVELAGAIAEIANETLARNFRNFDPSQSRIVLVEGGRLLATLPVVLGDRARDALRGRGVEVALGCRVQSIDERGVELDDGRRIDARTVIWAAGVRASGLGQYLGETDRGGRVHVRPDASVPEHPEVFVIGDLMHLEQGGEVLPGVAQLAMQSGRCAAHNVVRTIRGRPREEFRYRDLGMMATVGRSYAVAHVAGRVFAGFFAWVFWWGIHIFQLIGFRNRFAVFLEWLHAYLTRQRGARVIVDVSAGPEGALHSEGEPDSTAPAPERRLRAVGDGARDDRRA
jgi:NADH dehydrogenase